MGLFQKKAPPMWYVLRPAQHTSSSESVKEGPYTRATIVQLYADGRLADGAMLWTNERIFPNAAKPTSLRPVRIMEWRRLDQLPDPVVRQLAGEAAALCTPLPQHTPSSFAPPPPPPSSHYSMQPALPPNTPPPPAPALAAHSAVYPVGAANHDAANHNHYPSPPPPTGGVAQQPPYQQYAPAPPYAPSAHPAAFPQPSAYPMSTAGAPPASGMY